MPDQVVETSPKQANPTETITKKESVIGTFKHVVHHSQEGGQILDVNGMETDAQGASLNLAEIFTNADDKPAVYFETASGTIYKLSADADQENIPTLLLERSNRVDKSMWVDIGGQVEVGKGFERFARFAGTNEITSIETNTVKRAALFEHSTLSLYPDAQNTDIVEKFEHSFLAAGGILPQQTTTKL